MKIIHMKSTGLYFALATIAGRHYYANGYTRNGVIDKVLKIARADNSTLI